MTAIGTLGRRRQRAVQALAAILRLAENLDRSHSQIISGIELHDRGEDALLQRADGRRCRARSSGLPGVNRRRSRR